MSEPGDRTHGENQDGNLDLDALESKDIAVVGMAGRFPGAGSVAELWDLLCRGEEAVTFFGEEELRAAGVDAATLADPRYVRARGALAGAELFDAGFFGYTPREAEVMDPQHRLFLECAWEALEAAGHDPERFAGPIGLFAGAGASTYAWTYVLGNPALAAAVGAFQAVLGNDKDHLTTRVAYRLNLRGPAVTVQTACSTSLVGVHLACLSLANFECDLALAGGVSVTLPQARGYWFQEGGIDSPDGHCRAFDAGAQGTVAGSGVAVVALRRLADALADGDTVHAVIRGSAINNDGSRKVGYTAPSIDGQAEVVAAALALAGFDPATVGYVECHGTGTALGDPIEVAALRRAFAGSAPAGSCALGSLKSNLGHLDTAAGVAGLIKAALALEHGKLPPSLHFRAPNPALDLAAGPFRMVTTLEDWPAGGSPRRAGVSSFGIGGTNAHVVLEEPPRPLPAAPPVRPWQLLVLSARSGPALESATDRLAAWFEGASARWLESAEAGGLADAAFTLQTGRRAWEHRRMVVCRDPAEAVRALAGREGLADAVRPAAAERPVVFLFPGQGVELGGLGRELYDSEEVFRREMDRAAELLLPELGLDLRRVLWPAPEQAAAAAARRRETAVAQPALFALEVALARLWESWGVRPAAMFGHSVGELAAACLAGVLSFEEGLRLVAARGRLVQQLPSGGLLAVPLPEAELLPLLSDELALAAVNGPALATVSGPETAIDDLAGRLRGRGVACRRLPASHAFHSPLVEPAVEPFTRLAARAGLRPPVRRFVSGVTGTWIGAGEAADPEYWGRHLRRTVRFADGLARLLEDPDAVFLEVGPGRSLTALVRRQAPPDRLALASLAEPRDGKSEVAGLLGVLGRLWLAGVEPDWRGLHGEGRRRRAALPTYPFERRPYLPEPRTATLPSGWRAAPAPPPASSLAGDWAVVALRPAAGEALAAGLEALGARVHRIAPVGSGSAGSAGAQSPGGWLPVGPREGDYRGLLARAGAAGGALSVVVPAFGSGPAAVGEVEHLLALAAALAGALPAGRARLSVVTAGALPATGQEEPDPADAALAAAGRALGKRFPGLACRGLDLDPLAATGGEGWLAPLLAELALGVAEPAAAYRGEARWVYGAAPAVPEAASGTAAAALPAGHGRPALAGPFRAPEGELERALAAHWEDLLGISPIGRDDDFFALGGHSLLATQMMARLRDTLGVDLPLGAVFEAPTVAAQARLVAERREAGAPPVELAELPRVEPDPAHRHEPFPLTEVQQAYWLGRSGAFELGNVATHVYEEFSADGLDPGRFGCAWQGLIERHEMMRAVLLPDGRQRILPEVPRYEVRVADLRTLPAAEAEARLAALREEMAHQILPSATGALAGAPGGETWPPFDVRVSLLPGGRVRVHVSFDILVADAWSWEVLIRDLLVLYRDPGAALPPLELSFRDYVLAEEGLRSSGAYRRSLEYWRERLADLPPAPELPLACAPESLTAPRFVRRLGRLERAAWQRLKERAARAGLTPSAVLLAAFAEVLAVWSRGPRMTLNLTLFNRLPLHPQVDDVVGDFTSLTLLAVESGPHDGFEARARRLQERLWADLEHRLVSGVRVLRELARLSGGGGGRAAMPVVFTSTLNLAAAADDPAAGGGTDAEWGLSQTPQVWIDHQVAEPGGALAYNWDWVKQLFPAGLVEEMFAAYGDLVARLADTDEPWRERFPVGLPAGQEALAAAANDTAAALPAGLLHEPFLARAAEAPERPAVITADREVSYGELERLSGRLARRLRALGARPGQLVAVVLDKGWEQAAAALAVLRAGAAYLPADPALPAERLHHLLRYGEVALALTDHARAAALEWPDGVLPVVVEEAAAAAAAERAGDLPEAAPDQLAYVIYTSGSTGLPKGVMIEHRAARNTIEDVNRRFDLGPGDRVLALSSLSFDLSVWDLFGVWAAGGAVVMPDPAAAREPAHWAELAARHGVTVWNTVPALMEILVDHLEAGNGEALPALRLAMLSGDWIPVPLPDRIRARCGAGVRVVSLGGATEASIWSILYEVGAVDPAWPSIPYGRPMANQTFHVLDAALAPRPSWVPGELWIGGVGLARGYWRDPEKTAASFVVHPRTGERLYRTGDMGRRLPDGTLEFLGREDAQVKIHGHRIELGEVEAALLQHPAVRAAAAAAVGRTHAGKRLVAWYVPEPGEDPDADLDGDLDAGALRGFLAAKLPSYMVPVELRRLDALPLTANGKVDRRALAEAAGTPGEALESGVVDPRTPTEERLAALWAEALDLPRVGVTQTFYQLGGDSLLATRVLARVRETFEIDLPMRSFFEVPTVAELARVVDRLQAEAGGEQDKIRRALERLSGLSEDQIDSALAELAGEA